MRPAKVISCMLSIVGVCAIAPRIPAQTLASPHRTVIAANVVIDGKGHILHDVRIVIEGSKIVAIDPKVEGPVDYDLRGLTVLPVGSTPTCTLHGSSARMGKTQARKAQHQRMPIKRRRMRGSR